MAPSPQRLEKAAQRMAHPHAQFFCVKARPLHCPGQGHCRREMGHSDNGSKSFLLLHLHRLSSLALSRKTYYSLPPSLKIFVTYGSYRWDEERFIGLALGTRPGAGLGRAGARPWNQWIPGLGETEGAHVSRASMSFLWPLGQQRM